MESVPEPSSSASDGSAASIRPPSTRRAAIRRRRPRSRAGVFGALVWGLALSACGAFGLNSSSPTTEPAGDATVEFVIDGDTVDLIIDGNEERVRLIGIDAPESVSRSDPIQCYGPEASEALTGLLPPGTSVRISRDVEARDRFGRLLLYIHRTDDDLFINRYLIESGFADALFFEPNTSFEVDFTRARNDARAAGVGLWGACDGPDEPLN